MAAERTLYAKEERRRKAGERVDIPFLLLVLALLLTACMEPGGTTLPSAGPTEPSAAPTQPTIPTEPSTAPTQPELPACDHRQDAYENIDKTAFYANYTPSCCWEDANLRAEQGLLAGFMEVPEQMLLTIHSLSWQTVSYQTSSVSTSVKILL